MLYSLTDPNWKQPKCLPADIGRNTTLYPHSGTRPGNKGEHPLTLSATSVNLKGIMLSEKVRHKRQHWVAGLLFYDILEKANLKGQKADGSLPGVRHGGSPGTARVFWK